MLNQLLGTLQEHGISVELIDANFITI
ncbi:MAG: hypothetical protein R2788_03280 [Saprospiraceae bacterium]